MTQTNKIIAITGANCFIGRHLVDHLLSLEIETPLRLLAHSKVSSMIDRSDRTSIIKGNLLSVETLAPLVHGVDTVVNLAYLRGNSLDENLSAVRNLLDVAKNAGVKRFIHCSTAAVVGSSNCITITEDVICNPQNMYEKTKYEIEQILLEDNCKNCEIIILRPTAVFGSGGKNLVKIIDDIRYGNKLLNVIKCYVYGNRKMNLVPVETVTSALAFLINYPSNLDKETYIVSGDDSSNNNYRYVFDSVMEKAVRIISTFPNIYLPHALLKLILLCAKRSIIDPMTTFSSEKLRSIGYQPPVTFEEALLGFIEYHLNCSMR